MASVDSEIRQQNEAGQQGVVQLTPQESAEKMRLLFAEWTADESGYDEETWPQLQKALDEDRLSSRLLFSDE